MTKFWILITLLTLVLAVACGSEPAPTATPQPQPTLVPAASPVPTATPQPHPTPAPTITPVPTATPQPYPTPVPTATLSPTVTPASYWPEVYTYMVEFLIRHNQRANATPQARAAADYLAGELESFGYGVSLQELEFFDEHAALSIGGNSVDANPITNSAQGEVTSPLVYVGTGLPEELPSTGLKGRILLFQRGELTFQAMGETAQEKGALGALVFNKEPGNFWGGSETGTVPIASLSQEDGLELVDALSEGKIVTAQLSTSRETLRSQNVIADKSDADRTLYLVAHYVAQHEDTAGAEDNASGIAIAMQAAKAIVNRDLSFNVRVLLVGGVDIGTPKYIASMTEDERAATIGVLNLDTISSGRLGLVGTGELTTLAGTVVEELGIEYDSMDIHPRYYSADEYFNEEGFDALWIRTYIPREGGQDKIEFVSPDNLEAALEIVLGVVERLDEG